MQNHEKIYIVLQIGKMTSEKNIDLAKVILTTYSIKDLCDTFGRTRETIRSWRKKYRDFPEPVLWGGRELRFDKIEINEWWNKHKTVPRI